MILHIVILTSLWALKEGIIRLPRIGALLHKSLLRRRLIKAESV